MSMWTSATAWSSPAGTAVEDRLFRAVGVLRVVVLANALGWNLYHFETFHRPIAAAAALAVMSLWTAVTLWAYAAARRRTPALLVADLGVALAMLLATPWLKASWFHASVPGYWIIGALFAWAAHWRWQGGLAAGAALAVADLAQRSHVRHSDYGNAFLLVIGGAIVGFLCASLQRLATERDAAQREAAMAAERARLARAVHDGVLQVLALVQRRGREVPQIAELGELAGVQERELRALIRAEDAVGPALQSSRVDVAAALAVLERANVTVSTPGYPMGVPAAVAQELVAAARAALENVRRHVGEDAPAWLLLQAFPDRLELSIRDAGPGIPAGRLAQAAEEGRLGVSESISGRIADLGGTATVESGSFGTEWELVVPLEPRP